MGGWGIIGFIGFIGFIGICGVPGIIGDIGGIWGICGIAPPVGAPGVGVMGAEPPLTAPRILPRAERLLEMGEFPAPKGGPAFMAGLPP